jgi:Dullard-like phosphatase family protein
MESLEHRDSIHNMVSNPSPCKQKKSNNTNDVTYLLKERNPFDADKLTLVIDLDETLISAQLHPNPKYVNPKCYGSNEEEEEEDDDNNDNDDSELNGEAVAAASATESCLSDAGDNSFSKLESFQVQYVIKSDESEDAVVETVTVYKRPYLYPFLRKVSHWFEVVLFTSSLQEYADAILDHIEKEIASGDECLKASQNTKYMSSSPIFSARLYRHHCTRVNPRAYMKMFHSPFTVKDLGRLGRDLSKTVIIDNSPTAYKWHTRNAMPISTWSHTDYDCCSDEELNQLLPYLQQMYKLKDIRQPLARYRSQFKRNDLTTESESGDCCILS